MLSPPERSWNHHSAPTTSVAPPGKSMSKSRCMTRSAVKRGVAKPLRGSQTVADLPYFSPCADTVDWKGGLVGNILLHLWLGGKSRPHEEGTGPDELGNLGVRQSIQHAVKERPPGNLRAASDGYDRGEKACCKLPHF